MAPRKATQPPASQPVRASTRTLKPSRKRAQSVSQSVTQRSKKPKARTSVSATLEPPALAQNKHELIEISDGVEDSVEQAEDDVGEEAEQQEEEAEDDAREKEEKEQERPFKFQTTWKAICGKENLPSVRSACFTKGALCMVDIELWKNKIFRNIQPRAFRVVSLLATASHEKCRQADEFPQELSSYIDLGTVMSCLEEWHRQWPKRALSLRVTLYLEEEKPTLAAPEPQSTQARGPTATQAQLSALPYVLEAEQAAGNQMLAIADRWACLNTRCWNKGKTCWWSKTPGALDTAEDHYPIPGELFRRWSKEVDDEVSTIEQPSPQLVIALCKWKDRWCCKRRESVTKSEDQSAASTTSALLNAFLITQLLVTQLKQLNQQTSSLSSQTAPLTSSPIHMRTDSQDLLAEFFDWIMEQPGYNTKRKVELYTKIKHTLVEEEWELDTLRERRDGKGITEEIWDRYGFKIGTLAMIRCKISEFKLQRPYPFAR